MYGAHVRADRPGLSDSIRDPVKHLIDLHIGGTGVSSEPRLLRA